MNNIVACKIKAIDMEGVVKWQNWYLKYALRLY